MSVNVSIDGQIVQVADNFSYSTKFVDQTDYTVLNDDGYNLIMVKTGGSNRTIALPMAADNVNRSIFIIQLDSGSVTVDGYLTELIGSAQTLVLNTSGQVKQIISHGSGWGIFTPNLYTAANTSIADLNNRITATNVEDALQEIIGSGRTVETIMTAAQKTGSQTITGLWTFTGGVTMTGTTSINGGVIYSGTVDPTGTTRVNMNNYLYATRVYNAVWHDLAEFMVKAEDSLPGQVLVQTPTGLIPCNKRADRAVVGIHSDTYGYALGADDQENKVPVGLTGKVSVFIKEPVKIGDLLVSDVGGFASKATLEEEERKGVIIGKVLQDKETYDVERIEMLILNA